MVEVSFYLLSVTALAMLFVLFRSYPSSKKLTILLVMIGWIAYLVLLDRSDVLKNFDMPPRIPVLVVFPALIAMVILVNRNVLQEALKRSPLYIPILLQSFRILVELLIYATYQKGIFPQRATFEGLNFDILVGISALFMGIAIHKRLVEARGILIWNIASLTILSVTVYSFISTYYFTDFLSIGGRYQFVEFPYLLLASVLLPVALFLHVFSLKQVIGKS
ncbi:MAG: hypothetical protein R8G66_11480 [Cytophagales bacterium]|nr:hypothetical protein [Cytophagales bacterium]